MLPPIPQGLIPVTVQQDCGTLGYELLSKVTARVPRRYSH